MAETTTRKRTSRASRAAAQLQAAPEEPKAEAPKAATPAKPKREPMGPANYRRIHGGVTDAELVAVSRKALGDRLAGVTDEAIVAAMGWAYTEKSAIAKVTEKLAAAQS